GVGRDHLAGPFFAVGQVRRDGQLAPPADLHPGDPLVPALDDITLPEGKDEWLTPVPTGVELGAILERARVMHHHQVAGLCRRPVALLDVLTGPLSLAAAARRLRQPQQNQAEPE